MFPEVVSTSRRATQTCHNGQNPFAGPLSQPMWARAHRVPSAYHDTFDYGMYDRLYERFGDQQPRGGVVFKGSMKLLEAQDCTHCFHRFEIDTYGRGCVHNCAYCCDAMGNVPAFQTTCASLTPLAGGGSSSSIIAPSPAGRGPG